MINRAELKNFGPIEQLDWQNLGKINLIIGNNGCGKSFLLKALYCSIRTLEEYKRGDNPDSDKEILADKLYWTFQPEGKKIGNLVTKSSNKPLSLNLTIQYGLKMESGCEYSFGKDATKTISSFENGVGRLLSNSIFLPANEILSLHELILKSRDRDKSFGFDGTYVDLARALQWNRTDIYGDFVQKIVGLSENSHDDTTSKIDEIALNANRRIEEAEKKKIAIQNRVFAKCRRQLENVMRGGKVEYDKNEGRWYFKKGRQRFPMGMTGEGIKKIGTIYTLLGGNYLGKDSIIFIDEPESNLHPQAISQLLDIIAMLASQGIQFFLASHSYFVVKKLFLIAQEQKMSIPVLSYQDDEWVQSDLLDEMPDNPIIDESIRLYEEEVDLAFK